MKTKIICILAALLFSGVSCCAQDIAKTINYKASLSAVHITLQQEDSSLLTVQNIWRINFKNDSTLIVRYKDSTVQYYNIKNAVITADTITSPVYKFIPLYTDRSLKPYLADSTQTTVKFIIIEYK